jgi:vacuolar protein sorting-associated protein 13A/C
MEWAKSMAFRRSAPINVADVGRNHVVVPTERGASKQLLRIDIRLEGSTVFLFVAEEEGTWPLRIRNETDFPFTFEQTVSPAPERSVRHTC